MREITTHHTNDANRQLFLHADARDEANGNASHCYCISKEGATGVAEWQQTLDFQHGPIKENGINGITNEVLLAIVIDRLEGFESSKFACIENAAALAFIRKALAALESRTKAREARGVEGTNVV